LYAKHDGNFSLKKGDISISDNMTEGGGYYVK
jgi:hypothetical protein